MTLFALSYGVSASVLTIRSDTAYDYFIHLSGEFVLDGAEITPQNKLTTTAFNGATLTASDKSGKNISATCSEVFINNASITQPELICANASADNTIPAASYKKLLFSAVISLDNGKAEPSTLIDLASLRVDAELKIITEEASETTTAAEIVEPEEAEEVTKTEKIYPLTVKVEKVTAKKADTSFSSIVPASVFNHGKGLSLREREEIALSHGDFTIKVKFLEPMCMVSFAEIGTNLSAQTQVISLDYGDEEATFTLSRSDFFDIGSDELFETLTLKVNNGETQLKSLKIYYSTDTALSGAMRFREIILNKGVTSESLGTGLRYWTSSEPRIAGVTEAGIATAKREGTTVISADDSLWRSHMCVVTVISSEVPSTKISLPYGEAVARVGNSYKLPCTLTPLNSTDKISWATSDPTVVQINPKTGELLACAPGTATITAISSSGKTAQCKLTVKLPE